MGGLIFFWEGGLFSGFYGIVISEQELKTSAFAISKRS